jgi:hypothetical protein
MVSVLTRCTAKVEAAILRLDSQRRAARYLAGRGGFPGGLACATGAGRESLELIDWSLIGIGRA